MFFLVFFKNSITYHFIEIEIRIQWQCMREICEDTETVMFRTGGPVPLKIGIIFWRDAQSHGVNG